MIQEKLYLCIFSKNVRTKIFEEAHNIAKLYVNELNKYKSMIENDQTITRESKTNEHDDLLKTTWETAVLLNDLETEILSIPFLTFEFDNDLIKKFNVIKMDIMKSTYLSTQLLKRLSKSHHIFLSKKTMPNWYTNDIKNNNIIFNTNVYEKFEQSVIMNMYNELNSWANNNELSRSYKKFSMANKLNECLLYFCEFYKFIDNDNKKINEIYNKFKYKMKAYNR